MKRCLVVGALVVVSLFSVSVATACVNEVRLSTELKVRKVKEAEQMVAQGRHAAAIRAVLNVNKKLLRRPFKHLNLLERRALLVLALAAVESEGRFMLNPRANEADSKKQQARNIVVAVRILKRAHAHGHEQLRTSVALANGLLLLPGRHAEGMSLLLDLEARGLIAAPSTLMRIAEYKRSRGDLAGSEATLKRCREFATEPQQCQVSESVPRPKG